MKKVIFIDQPKEETKKPVEFTHFFSPQKGWIEDNGFVSSCIDKLVYLGKCKVDGDMFAVYSIAGIDIYKGHLNSGEY